MADQKLLIIKYRSGVVCVCVWVNIVGDKACHRRRSLCAGKGVIKGFNQWLKMCHCWWQLWYPGVLRMSPMTFLTRNGNICHTIVSIELFLIYFAYISCILTRQVSPILNLPKVHREPFRCGVFERHSTRAHKQFPIHFEIQIDV